MSADTRLRPVAFKWNARLDDFITDLAWSPDGTLIAAASVSGQVGLFDPTTGQPRQIFKDAHLDGCDALAWRPDGKALATAGRDGTWKLWPLEGDKPLVDLYCVVLC